MTRQTTSPSRYKRLHTVLLHDGLQSVILRLVVLLVRPRQANLVEVDSARMVGKNLLSPAIDRIVVAPNLAMLGRFENVFLEGRVLVDAKGVNDAVLFLGQPG